ncbi:MAG: histidinol dehydrogenase [Bacteroidia bacterium]|nr:histidinol dehydrogenase [Bacteroidia bacterium]
MEIITFPDRNRWPELLARPVIASEDLDDRVKPILAAVRNRGDAALKEFTARFDSVELDQLAVTEQEFAAAEAMLSPALKAAIGQARANIERFHASQREAIQVIETMPGVTCWRKSLPIRRVGLYIPGGTAPLFSTILMLGVPAILAGCETIVLCTPPAKDGTVQAAMLYTAGLLGIKQVFKVGGAQAIAALAFGTESIPAVDKIFGPGNQYVTAAKQLVSRDGIAIDLPAGPSEVCVVADSSAHPAFVAADLLSQAEHGSDSQVLLITDSEAMARDIVAEVDAQLALLPRRDMATDAIAHSRVLVMRSREEMVEVVNEYAPEHLILSVEKDEEMGEQITQAGSVFLGHYTPESAGDYASGTNHTLPTNGFARAYSGVSLDSFVKKVTFQKITHQGLTALGPIVAIMAEAEQLQAHARAVTIRLDQQSN